ncbi:MAG: aminoacyl-histidine dipeptidase [Lachnospiraceae bacterium]|nr:aminoacyl-histidine dipeptidase [Lachnospiraceae bacterium]
MGVLSNLEPEKVFYYFEEISKIPRGSYHEKQISDYLVQFANAHAFEVYQDVLYNVVMKIPASAGYEEEEPIILQGHMDMVCEKKAGSSIDMEKDGLQLAVDGDYVYAVDTTLGGDDGIAVAYMLAIADDATVAHPPLEYIITVSEEVGMEGANEIDLSMLEGHCMLNLDSEEEGIFLSSCAGGMSAIVTLPMVWQESAKKCWYRLDVNGLVGGHSGCEIDKERANANKVIGRILYALSKEVSLSLKALEGGKKDNAIPVQAQAVIGVEPEKKERLAGLIEEYNQILHKEYIQSDAEITVSLQVMENGEPCKQLVVDDRSLFHILAYLMAVPNGIQNMSMAVPGLVETSLNLGILELREEHLYAQHAIRSSVTTRKQYIAGQLECLALEFGGELEIKGEYPAWEYKEESVVRPRVIELYKKLYGKEPVVEGIHAGLECGLLAAKIPELDCVSMGPDILDIHTTAERLSISSTKRVYEFLLEYLKQR